MQGVRAGLVLLCLVLGCLAEQELSQVWRGSEKELYKNVLWESNFGTLVIVEQDSAKDARHEEIQEQLKDSGIFFVQVSCDEERGRVCEVLREHSCAVRPGEEELLPVDIPQEFSNMEAVFILQVLLKDRLAPFDSHNELKDLISEHEQLFIMLVTKKNSQEYLQLLRSWLLFDTPVAITTNMNALPLSYRPVHSFHPRPLFLWCLLPGNNLWFKFSYSSVRSGDGGESLLGFRDDLERFITRLQLPLSGDYDEDLVVGGYHVVYAFPGISSGSVDVRALLRKVSPLLFKDYLFFVCKRDTAMASRLFVTHEKPLPQVVVAPYGKEEGLFLLDVNGNDLTAESTQLRLILESYASEHPPTEEGPDFSQAPPLVSLIDLEFLKIIVEDKHTHVLLAFCQKGTEDCPGVPYEAMSQAMMAVQREDYLSQLGNLQAYIIECNPVADISSLGFSSLPSYGLFNFTRSKWFRMEKQLSKSFQAMAVLVLSSGLDELISVDLSGSHDEPHRDDYQADEEQSPLSEDDHFAQVLVTLPAVVLSNNPPLNNSNFEEAISQYDTSVVVFYMNWDPRSEVFLNHVEAAYNRLDKTANVCLAAVSCGDWTDLCSRQGITTYPTALVYTPSTLARPHPLTHLSTPHILNALGQFPMENDGQLLPELSPATLPTLMKGGLDTTLVIWCDVGLDSESDKVKAFHRLGSQQQDRLFTWMDSLKYKSLLMVVTKTELSSPTILVLKLTKHQVYQFAVSEGQSVEQFENGLASFLTAVDEGQSSPIATLPAQSWSPVQPPVPFPSDNEEEEEEEVGVRYYHGNGESPPPQEPPPHSHTEL